MFDLNSITGSNPDEGQSGTAWVSGYELDGTTVAVNDVRTFKWPDKKTGEMKQCFLFTSVDGDIISVPFAAEGKMTMRNRRYVANLCLTLGALGGLKFVVEEFTTKEGETAKCLWLCNGRNERLMPDVNKRASL